MPPRVVIPESREVARRFVESFNELRYRKLVKTKAEFCKSIGIAVSGNLDRMLMEDSVHEPSLTNILLLNEKYNVSLDWLMLGKGEFFSNDKK